MSEENPYAPPQTDAADSQAVVAEELIIPSVGTYASRWARLGGALIDGVILIIMAFGMGFLFEFLREDSVDGWFELESVWIDSLWSYLMIFASYYLLQSYFWHARGQSIGKIAVGSKIVMLDGSQATWSTIFWRRTVLALFISSIPKLGDLFDFIDVVMIFRREHNCLHDDFAGTRVVKVKR